MSMQTTQKLADYVCTKSYDDFDSEVIARAKVLCLSSLGAAVWGSRLRTGQILAGYAKQSGAAPEAGVIGAGFRTSAELASLVNGTANHATELEDVSHPGAIYTCQIIPALFALGEKVEATGKAILEAFVLGYEVQSRMGMNCPHGRGWLHAPQLGTIGVAAGAAKMLALNAEQTRNALSIAASLGCGLLRQTATDAHLFEAGAAGRNGIAAALLAKHGLCGSATILEGKGGYWDALAGRPQLDFELGRHNDFRVMNVNLKKYPCCGLLQRIIDGIVALVADHDISCAAVDSIEVEVSTTFAEMIKYTEPENGDEGRFSLQHSVAAVLLRERNFLFDSFTDEAVKDPRFTSQWRKVKAVVRPEFATGIMEGDNPVTIRLHDGTEYRKVCKTARGDAADPLTEEQVAERYRLCVRGTLGDAEGKRSADLLLALERQRDISELMRILTFPSTR